MANGPTDGVRLANGVSDHHQKTDEAADDEYDDDVGVAKADAYAAAEAGLQQQKGSDGGGMRVTFQVSRLSSGPASPTVEATTHHCSRLASAWAGQK